MTAKTAGSFGALTFQQRQALVGSNEWNKAVSAFVEEGVIQQVNSTIDALRKNAQIESDFDAFTKPDYIGAVDDSTYFVGSNNLDQFFYFDIEEMDTAKVNENTGECVFDFAAFAKANGVDLADWRYDIYENCVVPVSEAGSVACPESDVVKGFVFQGSFVPSPGDTDEVTVKEIIECVIVPIFEASGREDLAAVLRDEPWSVLGVFVNGEYPYINKEFEPEGRSFTSEEEICRFICSRHDLDPCAPNIHEYYLVQDWFGKILKDEGLLVAEICDLKVWGREECGSAISMSMQINEIFAKKYPEKAAELIREVLSDVKMEGEESIKNDSVGNDSYGLR